MNEGEAIKYFKGFGITFKKNKLNLHEVMEGKITIPSVFPYDDLRQESGSPLYTTQLEKGNMLNGSTIVNYAEIMQFKIEEAQRFK